MVARGRAWVAAVAALLAATPALAGSSASPAPPPPPAVDLSGVPDSASVREVGPDGKPHPVHARLLADRVAVRAGETVRLGLHLDQDDGWHTYWKGPGEVGQPTLIDWELPDGATVTAHDYPVPQRFEQEGIVSFGYDDQVLLIAELTVPESLDPGTTAITADARWLVCERNCIPGGAKVTLPVEVLPKDAPEPAASPYAPLFDHYAKQHPVPLEDVKGLGLEWALHASAVQPNQPFRAILRLTPTDGRALVAKAEQGMWPAFALGVEEIDFYLAEKKVCTQADGSVLVVLEGETFEPDPLPTDASIGGLFQVTLDGEPVAAEASIPLTWAASDAAVVPSTSPLIALADACKQQASAAPPVTNAGPEEPPPGGGGRTADQVAGAALGVTATGPALLALMLLAAFVGGLILNIMPCVLPVLTLKLYGLVGQAAGDVSHSRRAGLAYTSGVLSTFLLLAAAVVVAKVAFGMELSWGFQFQYPGYVAALATIVFLFGLSLFGVFELPAIGSDGAARASEQGGLRGDFAYGVFAVLLATPCSAPFLGPAVGYAFSLPTSYVPLFFGVIGLGLASPFLLVAFFPRLIRFLPKPGAWMNTFKQVMGFTLIATTIWLVTVMMALVGPDGTAGFLIFLGFVAFGAWIFGEWGGVEQTGGRQVSALGVGVVVAGLGGAGFLELEIPPPEVCEQEVARDGLDFSERMPWQPFSEAAVASLEGRTIFIDFTAEWCLSCKVNERTVLETRTVRAAMDELDVVPLKADWTRGDPVITEWLKRYGRAGVPFYLVIPADPDAERIPLPEVITPDMVVSALERASRPAGTEAAALNP